MSKLGKVAAACAAVVSFQAFGDAPVSAAYYVQHDLVALYDAIDNVGFGQHDGAAPKWKDLSGNGHDFFVLNSNGKGGSWEDAAFLFNGPSASLDPQLPYYRTQEVRLKVDSGRSVLIGSGQGTGNPGVLQGLITINGTLNTFQTSFTMDKKTTQWLDCSSAGAGPFTTTVLYGDPTVGSESCWCNGAMRPKDEKTGSNNWENNGISMIGAHPAGATTYDASGRLYSIRLYSVQLTKEEIERNMQIDRIRFEGEKPPADVSPSFTCSVEVNDCTATISWSAEDFGWLAETLDVVFEYSTTPDFAAISTTVLPLATATTEKSGTYVLTDLRPGTTYYARARAVNDVKTEVVVELAPFLAEGSSEGLPVFALGQPTATPMEADFAFSLMDIGAAPPCRVFGVLTGEGRVVTNDIRKAVEEPLQMTISLDSLQPTTEYLYTVVVETAGGARTSLRRAFTTLAETYPVYGYDRQGLILQLDAKANALVNGLAVHDANATTWADLAGEHVFEPQGAAFNVANDAYEFPSTASYLTTSAKDVSDLVLDGTFTIETLTRHSSQPSTENDNWALFSLGSGSSSAPRTLDIDIRNGSGAFQFNRSGWSDASRSDVKHNFIADLTLSVVGGGGSGRNATAYADGVSFFTIPNGDAYTKVSASSTVLALRYYNSSAGAMKYRAFRVYSRTLSAAQLLRNRAADAARYLGGEIPALGVADMAFDGQFLTATLTRADAEEAAPVTAILSSRYGEDDVPVWLEGGFAAGETTLSVTCEVPEGTRYVRFAAQSCVTPTVAVSRYLPEVSLTASVTGANAAALIAHLSLAKGGEVSCYYGESDGVWDGNVSCGTVGAGERDIVATGIPASARVIRFRSADGSWSEAIDLAAVRTTDPIAVVNAVTPSDYAVTLAATVYLDAAGTCDFAVAFGDSADELEPAVTLAEGVVSGEPFTAVLRGLLPDHAYVIRPSVAGVKTSSADVSVRTLESADETYGGPQVVVSDDPNDPDGFVLSFAAPGEELKLYALTGVADAGVMPSNWTTCVELGTVAADATSATVKKPDGWGDSVLAVRYFIGDRDDASFDRRVTFYRTAEGGTIFGQWDTMDNAGVGVHDDTVTGLKDLRGEADLALYALGQKAYVGSSSLPRAAVFNGAFTVEVFARVNSTAGTNPGVFSIGDINEQNGQRVLMLDLRTQEGSIGALQYLDTGWRQGGDVLIMNGAIPVAEYAQYAVTVDASGAHFFVNGQELHKTNGGTLQSAAIDTFYIGRYGNDNLDFDLGDVRFHDRALSAEELAANLALDRARFLDEPGYPREVLAMSACRHYQASSRPVLGPVAVSGLFRGDVATVSGSFSGIPESVTVSYWAVGGEVTNVVDATIVGSGYSAELAVTPAANWGYRVTAARGAFAATATGAFTTPGASVLGVESHMDNATFVAEVYVAQQGAGDSYAWIEAKTAATDFSRISEVSRIPSGSTAMHVLSQLSPFWDEQVIFRVVCSNSCSQVENGSWVTPSEGIPVDVRDGTSFVWTGTEGLWSDASHWTVNEQIPTGYGIPQSAGCKIGFPANKTQTIGVDGAYAFGEWSLGSAVRLTLTGTVEQASLTGNIMGVGNLTDLSLELRNVVIHEANGINFGVSGSAAQCGNNLIAIGKGAVLETGSEGATVVACGLAATEIRLSDDGMFTGTCMIPVNDGVGQIFRFEGAAPQLALGRFGSGTDLGASAAIVKSDVNFVFNVPAGGYLRTPLLLTGTGNAEYDRFGRLDGDADSTGKLAIGVDADSPALKAGARLDVQLVECAAGIETNNVRFVASDSRRAVKYSYTYGWPSVKKSPAQEGDLPTGIRMRIPPKGLVVFFQ